MLCSLAPSEVAGRVVVGAEEDLAREQRHQSDLVRSGGDTVVVVVCTVVSKMYTRDGVAVSDMHVHDLASVT